MQHENFKEDLYTSIFLILLSIFVKNATIFACSSIEGTGTSRVPKLLFEIPNGKIILIQMLNCQIYSCQETGL